MLFDEGWPIQLNLNFYMVMSHFFAAFDYLFFCETIGAGSFYDNIINRNTIVDVIALHHNIICKDVF